MKERAFSTSSVITAPTQGHPAAGTMLGSEPAGLPLPQT